ncbi:phosphonate metabolism protein/1,5-bisphosphokinase (PRPP-forming) PhnN [Azorhizobium doebereinerae]|uniref:phosphonate metabolism protein/1,5-bisphosphokinase (PRPP-forming) PhnN n=1 Tax=Azorhizobium doebereinerae TaxID=281091 RepID=UPI0003F4DE2D|nr:phosphonate metabolism protein/1,5-bisphosphokinase (PRPP-forming) PhnN [Azorhizobium doebereinerae]
MGSGLFFFVVGPSGSGKDTLIEGAKAALGPSGRYVFARRAITRPADAGGEAHEALSVDQFEAVSAARGFLLQWQAHGLRYGLRADLLDEMAAGRHVVANGSRAMVAELAAHVPHLVVVEITAPAEVLAQRLTGRGREAAENIAARLDRKVPPFPAGVAVIQVANDSTPRAGVERFVAALEGQAARLRLVRMPIETGRRNVAFLARGCTVVAAPDYLGPGRVDLAGERRSIRAEIALVSDSLLAHDAVGLSQETFAALGLPEGAELVLTRTPVPESRAALRRKIRGEALDEPAYVQVVGDIVEGRYPDSEVAGFLVAADRGLTDGEVLALAKVRASFANRIVWGEPMVVDKHSMGGIPGSRITMIVVPIVAAHGLAIPKTSSRAITSAAGTADAMETLARVDLDAAEVRRTVERARGCIAWNGRLSHSALDDVMNAITRPLGLDSTRWSVASILSKKLAAGSTHVVIDLPFGARARVKSAAEAAEMARLFEQVGAGLGLTVEAIPTDGSGPIGRGIGPALEVRDVLWVLEGHPDAPPDLREKALFFASRILAWDPAVGPANARARAEALLASGAARAALERICEAQGRWSEPVRPARLTRTVVAATTGTITNIDGFAVAGIARLAGAPQDKGAGIDLKARSGDHLRAGDPLFVIHASSAADLDAAAAQAATFDGFTFDAGRESAASR